MKNANFNVDKFVVNPCSSQLCFKCIFMSTPSCLSQLSTSCLPASLSLHLAYDETPGSFDLIHSSQPSRLFTRKYYILRNVTLAKPVGLMVIDFLRNFVDVIFIITYELYDRHGNCVNKNNKLDFANKFIK